MPDLDLDDIQGLIARAYPDLVTARYLLLQIGEAANARAWLGGLIQQITPAPARPTDMALNLALTPSGLKKLGLPDAAMGQFSNELVAGMTTPHRRRNFGDVGANAPEQWLWGGPNTPSVDVLLLLFARDVATLNRQSLTLASSFARGGVAQVQALDATVDLDGKEHFGFADGISQPTIDGLSSRKDIPANTIAPGEFILGYVNEYGLYTDRPLLDPSADPQRLLPPDAEGSGKLDLARNGSYLVLRQLAQDVRGFWRYLDQATRQAYGSSDASRRTWLASRLVGRWPSGAPVTLTPDADDPLLSTANDFTYQYADESGLSCPIGAHVRRSHPRDTLDPDPGTERSVALDRRHRLLRRGREYGPPVIGDPLAPAPPDDPERGLYFVCLAGNISRQFELVQGTWLNNPTFGGLYDEPDPLTASRINGASFSVPAEPVRQRYKDLPQFVTVRGGAYFFLPGIRTLRYLASLVK